MYLSIILKSEQIINPIDTIQMYFYITLSKLYLKYLAYEVLLKQFKQILGWIKLKVDLLDKSVRLISISLQIRHCFLF